MRATVFSLFLFATAMAVAAADYMPRDVVWMTPSRNSSESMPCGGHDIGMNVWVEKGELLFYVSQSGWFDENNTLLKAGRWRLHIDSDPFSGNDFRQRLCLDDGAVYVSGGGVEVRLWADVFSPVVFVAIKSQHTERATLSYESWRYRDRVITKGAESQQCSYKWLNKGDCVTFADSIQVMRNEQLAINNDDPREPLLRFWHQNRTETVFDYTVAREGLDAIKDSLYNPIGGLLMEGEMRAPGFRFTGTTDGTYAATDYRAWNFRNEKLKKATIEIRLSSLTPDPSRRGEGSIYLYRGETAGHDTADNVTTPLPQAGGAGGGAAGGTAAASARWWHAFWQRSWIQTDNAEAATMVRNYELMRYMLACNAYGQWPTKFNGGLFTFDPVYVDSTMTFTPDYRRWGGGTMTAQNQRLLYWPMLRSGDYDMMAAQIATYYRMLPNAIARTRFYWGHGGASFTEQIENFGLPNPAEYGKHPEGSDMGVERNAWLEYEWDTALEFAMMELLLANSDTSLVNSEQLIVNSYDYCSNGKDNDVMQRNEQSEKSNHNYSLFTINYKLAEEVLRFFSEHYRWQARKSGAKELDEQGRLIIYPGSGCETYKMAYNPSSTIAALRAVSEKLGVKREKLRVASQSELPTPNSSLLTPNSSLLTLNSSLPPLPLRVIDSDTCIAPAVAWARVQNTETPQLYPVWPWRLYGLGRPGLDVARNTYWKDPHAVEMRSVKGWKQDNIWAACLGLTDEARRLNTEKLCNGPYRFPTFYDPGFDWAPDLNRGGAAMTGLQEMLLQETPDGELLLFPAWPREWNCTFRLHTLDGRTVEAAIKDGSVTSREISTNSKNKKQTP